MNSTAARPTATSIQPERRAQREHVRAKYNARLVTGQAFGLGELAWSRLSISAFCNVFIAYTRPVSIFCTRRT